MKLALCQFLLLNIAFAGVIKGQSSGTLKEIKVEVSDQYTIEELFQHIESATELSFSFDRKDLKGTLKQKIDFAGTKQLSVEELLLHVSEKSGLGFKRINNTINVLKTVEKSQPKVLEVQYPISGVIRDDSGAGLPGATIQVKGTQLGTVTDIDGGFSFNIPDGKQVLIISFIGFTTVEIEVDQDASPLDITMMTDIEALEEVVVVGYGQQNKESITGSVAKIDSKDIVQTKTANVANNLVGRLPGLVINARGGQPGQENMEIFIRGKGTFGNAQPLYVIDGVANRGTFERLNPEDIESISVLKDASAAIYGAQAANGVILITTKRGSEGKPKLQYSNSFALTQPARRQQLMGAEQYLTWLDEQNLRNNRPQIYQRIIGDYQTGENDPELWADTDWWSEAMDTWSPQYQHNLSISGGSEQVKYFVSGQHLFQDAIYKGDAFNFSQNNIRSNIDIQATSFLKIGLDLAGRIEHRSGRKDQDATEDVIRGVYNMAPFESPYFGNGLLRETSKGNIIPYLDGSAGGADYKTLTLNNKLSWELSFDQWIKGLSIIGFGAYDARNISRKELNKPFDIYFRDTEGQYINLREETGNLTLFQQTDEEVSLTLHSRINYARSIGKHEISAFVAYEQNQVNGEYLSASRIELVSEDLPYLFTGSEANLNNDGKGWQFARVNYFGRFNYQFDQKYLAELTLRRDGSQNFPSNNRFGTFPGISLGWRISEEAFWNVGFIDEFKLRGSWGILGNDRVANFQYLQLFNVTEGQVFGENPTLSTGLIPNTAPNPNITWETARKTNAGVDLGLKDGLLDMTIDAFYEERSDILATRNASVPIYSGIQLPDENLGKTTNKGLEISATHRRYLSRDFQYQFNGQFTYARNKIVFLDESPFVPDYQKLEGSPIDYLLVYKADGLYQNWEEIDASPHFPDAKPGDVKFVDVNEDGVINAEDRILLPEGPTPRIVYGFAMGANYRGLELNAFFQGQAGASTIYRPWDINMDTWYFENRWISEEETPDAVSPAAWDMSSNTIQSVSTIWVRDNDFLRIKNVELAYTFPTKLIETVRMSNLRIFVNAFNLGFIYDSVKLYDPESRSDTGWYYPQQRMFTTGLSATF